VIWRSLLIGILQANPSVHGIVFDLALFAASGFRLARVVPTQARVCVIEGERA
jgi:hypothetical protein